MDVCQWNTLISVYFGQRNSNNLATVCSAFASENSFTSGCTLVGHCERIQLSFRQSDPRSPKPRSRSCQQCDDPTPLDKVTKVNFCFLTFRISGRERKDIKTGAAIALRPSGSQINADFGLFMQKNYANFPRFLLRSNISLFQYLHNSFVINWVALCGCFVVSKDAKSLTKWP